MSLLCVVSVLRTLRYRSGLELGWRSRDPSDGSLSYITPEEQHLLSSSPLASDINEDLSKCTMTSCFDLSRCVYQKEFKVYVYPPSNLSTVSTVYSNILKVIRESSLYTDSPQRACVFVLSIDTIDRDRIRLVLTCLNTH
ncbi:hypothetical protein AB6A40_009020 [Gnathostoma spinigerum]|uniref:Uncharacterized protein n=1 Tax=Gnathostoma spinigerum TaxID=75299 RepID=A0ABD6ER33_9BILA